MVIQDIEKTAPRVENREPLNAEEILILQEMAEAGLLYGMSKSKTHPGMKPHIFTTRSGIEVINLESTIKSLGGIAEFMRRLSENGKNIMIVGTSPAAKNAVREYAEKLGQHYVCERWLGGTLTNFKAISERIKYYNKLISDKEAGLLNKYTKKERVIIDRQIAKMKKLFEGIRNMNELPAAVFILDIKDNVTAAKEAKQLGIPVIAIINTDTDPKFVDYPIPGNNRLPNAISWILKYFEPSMTPKMKVQIF